MLFQSNRIFIVKFFIFNGLSSVSYLVSHIFISSLLALAIVFPFILTKNLTRFECPSSVLRQFPVIISHIFIVLKLALAIVFPFILTDLRRKV